MKRSHRQTPSRVLTVLGCLALGACTMVGAPSPSGPVPPVHRSPPPRTASGGAAGSAALSEPERITRGVVDTALAAIGTPYEWGGTSSNGFDCSGLIQYAYGRFGISLPRVSHQQMRVGTSVSPVPSRLSAGDVLGFSESRRGRPTHVGLYIGGGDFIHSGSDGVRISSLDNPYWIQSLVAVRRIVG